MRIGTQVVDTTNIFHMQQFEDIVNAGNKFYIRTTSLHELRVVSEAAILVVMPWEIEQAPVISVLWQEGIVLIRQMAEEEVAANILTPLEVLEQRNAVEELTIEVPRQHDRCITVGDELHIVDELIGIVFHHIAEVGHREAKQREGHLVPLALCLGINVELTPCAKPETLIEGELCKIIVVLSSDKTLEANGVRHSHHRRVMIGL